MIILDINGADAVVRAQDTLTCGRVGEPVRFRFDGAWDGLTKTAVFRCASVSRDCFLEGDTAAVPHEVLTAAGVPLQIGVYGTDGTGRTVIPTVWAKTEPVLPGADPSGDPEAEPTLPIWAQLRESTQTNTQNISTLSASVDALRQQTAAPVRMVAVELPAANWSGSGSLFSQQVTLEGLTPASQVNLAPTAAQMMEFCQKDYCFLTENDGGKLLVYLLGTRPTEDYTLQAGIEEVRA